MATNFPWPRSLEDFSKLVCANANSPASLFLLSTLIPATYLRLKKSVQDLSKQLNDPNIRKKRSLLHEKYSASKVPEDLDYIVIGSGISGLSAAAILARLGRKVLVLEQHHDTAGGCLHEFELKGYKFDSGLHYTVPWGVPLTALTCLKKPKDCVPHDLMLEKDGTIDRLYLVEPDTDVSKPSFYTPFRIQHHEPHLARIYEQFPDERAGLDKYMELSDHGMLFVKLFVLARLFPKYLQKLFWWLVPSSVIEVAASTAKEVLPKIIRSKKLISLLSSMWIDTGVRPDEATFMLIGSVFRGIPMEGGCYPRGGSAEIAKELVTVIESAGGKVLIRADVESLCTDPAGNGVTGVRLRDGKEIRCRRSVISSTGYFNTMNSLVPRALLEKYDVPRALPVKQSPGFIMANIGINCPPEAIGATVANTWHVVLDEAGDIFPPLARFFEKPLEGNNISAFITFPCLKDTAADKSKTSCQVLLVGDFSFFQDMLPAEGRVTEAEPYKTYTGTARAAGYEQLKEAWKQKSVEIFLKYFPKAAPHLELVDLSTPLSIQYYIRGTHGAAVGLGSTPNRFVDPWVREQLDPITKIPGLALTGQDTLICGVVLAQMAGVVTALRLEGAWAALKILAQSLLLGDN